MKYFFANWKMYLNVDQSVELANELAGQNISENCTVALFPSALAFTGVRDAVLKTKINVGAQNCNWTPRGAYTGAISAELFAEAGAKFVLVGHSERRHIFGETDTDVRKKIDAALDAGLIPVVCIGETQEEKENGRREYRLKKQLMKAFEGLVLDEDRKIMVAYEPIWAIGSGTPCLPADADDVHGWIQNELKQYTSATVPILYGGSVDAKNVESYFATGTIDGVLVGSASADRVSCLAILEAIASSNK
ncbi:MAG: triose-phosphate isomerase [Candidatus Magasanikbacteria bacterium]|nr:triose-phosphate isomerase [Candidatus Magasanikbacteria bacterium]